MPISTERAEELTAKLASAHEQLVHERERYGQMAVIAQRLSGGVSDELVDARRRLLTAAAGESFDVAQHELRLVVFEALGELLSDQASSRVLLALLGVLDEHLLPDL